jgi:hypothetical protein
MTDAPRDYAGEMRRLIDQETVGTYVPGIVATRIVDRLRAEDPDLLVGWLHRQAATFVREAINRRDSSLRTRARYHTPRSVFRADAVSGDPERVRRWMDVRFTVEDGMHMPLRDMTKANLEFVAATYELRARGSWLQKTFLQRLAEQVGRDRVEDRFSDDDLTVLWEELNEPDRDLPID